eukprot:7239656-Karenia_brevis.AAC.1
MKPALRLPLVEYVTLALVPGRAGHGWHRSLSLLLPSHCIGVVFAVASRRPQFENLGAGNALWMRF